MDYKKTLKYLYGLESQKIKLGLDRVQILLDDVGNPEKSIKCIHVAGSNGKGSTCAMIFHVLREAGYNVGLYTSPHLKNFNERIRVNDNLITNREIADCFLKVKPFITNQSFFEITTAMAFLYFKEKNVDFVVLETGLGGRLDATNVVTPLISIITNISLEHTDLLGNTIKKIAFEKAGIIKQNVPVVTGAKGEALSVIKKIAKERNAPLYLSKKYPKVEFKHLNGEYQQKNKDTALTAIDVLIKYHSIKLDKNQIINGIKKTKWQGRLDFVSRNVMIDASHNADGFKLLKQELFTIKKQKHFKNILFVIGIQNDKDYASMLKTIIPLASTIIFTKSNNPKALSPEQLLKSFNKINKSHEITAKIVNNPKKALEYAKKTAKNSYLVVATGSIYLIGEFL
ncbi:MAG TPA: folylpolyglutamate synthase/dihydrofolate synthase family protein [Candidatus Nanoarchaeia archaeon]|nr:folylpolyglutamate synthase/dihydrofolate synthase family protein [Candidatus Nanoarchaeia archaeon]